MAMAMLESGPKLDWTRDNQIFLHYKKWRSKIELIFRSALSTATPEEKTAYLKYWMGDEGLPLIEKWESTGKLDYSNARETPAKEGGRSRPLSSGFKLETYWSLLEEEFKPKDDFQAKNTHSTQRKGEETPDTRSELQDEAFQLIQKIHNQLQEVQWDLQRLHSLHKYKN